MSVVEETRKFAMEMADRYGVPSFQHTEFVTMKGKELAKKLHADEKLVVVSCYLIDIALGKALKEGRQHEHVKMGVETAKQFLAKFNLGKGYEKKILNAISAHHGQVKHTCIESEIVKNADNYRFLDPRGVMISLFYHPKDSDFKQTIEILKQKLEEKHNLVTLDICKKEMDGNYKIIKQFLDKAVESD